ncbi:uncharacterized protein stbd1 isoform X1 [Sinocyclocheilus anshuiensis]|uniref:Starch-binding domain-containing protein 1 n=1 Tax=Sinocyclocheilus anshuiensis TaxID=1608454 RepID=A0A671QGC3_9TELE|nr:PREDICTED: uncharacterized protein LOC107661584 isoform X1 [Sinocyclocheilus anshuiensis]XP_016306727.1 PREDICTED: uncharacterized protein LOC107661584 isoform X1 [Sinocyclocheilus anshuiensis]
MITGTVTSTLTLFTHSMTMKKSKPIALDRRDIHSLLDVIGGFGAVVAVGIIGMLSVCAAFFIYRSFRGQRGKGGENNGNETTIATGEGSTARRKRERDDRPTESTGECQGEKQKKCSNLSSTDNMLLPTEVPEKDLNESTLKDLEEITDELLSDFEPEMGEKTASDLDQCVEMDPDENTECEEHIQYEDDDGREVLADVSVGLTELDIQCSSVEKEIEEYLDKSVSLDTDELSETESAREIIFQRHQYHITTQSNYSPDQAPSNPSKIQLEENSKTSAMEEVENTSKKFEHHHDCRFPRTNNFDCCCCDKKTDTMEKIKGQPWFHTGSYATDAINLSPAVETMVNHSSRFDFQNYLGFQTDNTFMGGSSTQMSLSQEKKTDEEGASVQKKHEKNEISIMDAIMDNNEWLNVDASEFRDLPWLSPTASEEKEGQVKTGLAKDDEEPVSKRVATVPPLSQTVNVTFRIHYITYSPNQLVAVTGSLQELGAWERFVPLRKAKHGFWANTISLPVESQVEWKFILVDDGRISRWEECGNRYLFLTSQDEDIYLDKCWGCC